MLRHAVMLSAALVLSACATNGVDQADSGNIEIQATSGGQAVAGAQCVASNAAGRWDFVPPAVVPVGAPAGDLRVSCSKPGYRTSEVLYRPSPYAVGGNPNVGIGIGGGSGNVGVGFGFNFPLGGGVRTAPGGYPQRIVVEMTPQ